MTLSPNNSQLGVPVTFAKSLIALAASLQLSSFTFADTAPLIQLLAEASGDGVYRQAHPQHLSEASRLFAMTCRADVDFDKMAESWKQLDFELLEFNHHDARVLLLRESADHQLARGFYAFRPESKSSLVLQAPHSFHDQHTGQIGAKLFLEGDIFAAGWNTVHRSQIDFAHTRDNFLCSFTEGVATARTKALFVQLHGFKRTNRTTRAAAETDIIVSNSSNQSDAWSQAVATSLRISLPGFVTRIFPHEVSELGGTSNVQAAILDRYRGTGFLHLEMSHAIRRKLRDDEVTRRQFLKALTETVEKVSR